MNRYFTAALFAIAVLGVSCKKEIQPAEIASANPHLETNKCEIARIIVNNPFGAPNIITFTYNQKGDPVSVTPSIIDSQSPELLFRYDKRGRLTDYIIRYDSINFYF